MDLNRVTLLSGQANPIVPVRSGPYKPEKRPRTYSADAKNTVGGALNVAVDFYGSDVENPGLADEQDWTKIGTVNLVTDGVNRISGGFVSDDTWNRVKAVISAAPNQATLVVNAFASAQ